MAAAVRLSEVRVDGDDVVWAEGRPAEGGRTQLVRRRARRHDAPSCSPRRSERAHRGARVRRRRPGGCATASPGSPTGPTSGSTGSRRAPRPPSRSPRSRRRPRADRYADGDLDPDGATIVCVRERHAGPAADRRAQRDRPARRARACPSRRCWSAARTSWPRRGCTRTACTLAWLQWNHPSMPWDDVELRTRNLVTGEETVVAGGPDESVLGAAAGARTARCGSCPTAATGGTSTATRPARTSRPWCGSTPRSACRTGRSGSARYAVLRRRPGGRRAPPQRVRRARRARRRTAGSPSWTCRSPRSARCGRRPPARCWWWPAPRPASRACYRVDLDAAADRVPCCARPATWASTPATCPRRRPSRSPRPPRTAPRAPRTRCSTRRPTPSAPGPPGELPPLLVVIHGGPTSAAVAGARPRPCSTGPAAGSPSSTSTTAAPPATAARYREELLRAVGGRRRGRLPGRRPLARPPRPGRRATGCASAAARPAGSPRWPRWPATTPPFAAGADHFGVADLDALAADTHKFESRYLDRLVGPYPEDAGRLPWTARRSTTSSASTGR